MAVFVYKDFARKEAYMSEMYYVDVYAKKYYKWMDKFEFKIKKGPYGDYYTIKVNSTDKNKIIKYARRNNIKYRTYEEKWERSSDYRKEFFKNNMGPYKCRYCNKRLKAEYMVVDHLIPIAKLKTSMHARNLLYIQGISSVNDIRNLAPSCNKCNQKKGDKIGLWFVKGMLGKYEWYWKVRKVLFFIMSLVLLIIFLLLINVIKK